MISNIDNVEIINNEEEEGVMKMKSGEEKRRERK